MSNQVDNLQKALPAIAKTAAQKFPFMMQGYIGRHFDVRAISDSYRSGGSRAFDSNSNRNTGDKLRISSSNLFRSYAPGHQDNISTFQQSGSKILAEYGTNVIYARIHEQGGTIQHPGGTDYMITEGGRAVFLTKNDPRSVGKTKPHPIVIRARPSLGPAFEDYKEKGLPIQQGDIRRMMFEVWNG